MIVHAERSLTENLLAFSGLFERHQHLGLTASPEGTAEMLRQLQVITAQARRSENTVRELSLELTEEAALPPSFGQVKPDELAGTPAQRIEWMAIETVQCASFVARSEMPERFALASQLRYVANYAMATAQKLQDAEQQPIRPGMFGWVRGVIDGGRSC